MSAKPMTAAEAAKRLDCHPSTITRLIRRGLIAAKKSAVGGRLLIERQSVERLAGRDLLESEAPRS